VTARLLIVVAAVLFSTGGAAIKACSLSGWQVACYRSVVAAATLLVLLPGARGRWSRATWLVGGAYAATMVLFVTSTKLTTAANAIFLQSTAPLYLLVIGPWVLREPFPRRDLPVIAILGGGLALILLGGTPAQVTAPRPDVGNALALASGVTWAWTLAGIRWAAHDARGTGTTLVAGNLIAAALCAAPALALPGPPPSVNDWSVIAFLGVFQIALAYVCLSAGAREVTALDASLLILIEPVLNPVWTWLVHGEVPGRAALAGGAIVLAATASKTWLDAARVARA